MAITVLWPTASRPVAVIQIPRADMPVIQASPERRSLDADQLHQDLRAIQASSEGAVYSNTHKHEQESTLSGIVYARKVEILPPYEVEFEDGVYGVVIVGANHNIADRTIDNQVKTITNNSAGLIANLADKGDIG